MNHTGNIGPAFLKALIGLLCVCLPPPVNSGEPANSPKTPRFTQQEFLLPGAQGLVSLDYFVFDAANHLLWVPASNTGTVAIIDGKTNEISSIAGFKTGQVDYKGKRPTFGPSSVALGDGVVYVGNRADSTVCVVDARTLRIGECMAVASPSQGLGAAPDAITYVAAARELWVTRGVPPMEVPSFDHAITVLDATSPAHLKPKDTIPLGASAEGFAVDNLRGRFYTSLEEKGETVSVDVHSHKIVARWRSGCDEPHGLALDAARGILFVACISRVVSMDVEHQGQVLGSLEIGAGLDNIDYLPSKHVLYAAAADAAVLTLARVDEHGKCHTVAVQPTQKGARGVVADSDGNAYVIDPLRGRILKLTLRSVLADQP